MAVIFKSYKKQVQEASQAAKDKALEIIGGKAESYAKKLCPVDTGNLRNSITHQQRDSDTEVIGTNVEYAPFVELGHHTSSGTMVAPRPYLKPAAENHSEEYRQIAVRVFNESIGN